MVKQLAVLLSPTLCEKVLVKQNVNANISCLSCVLSSEIGFDSGRAGVVLTDVVACGFKIISLGVFWLNRRQAEEFYEIYQRIYIEAEFMVIFYCTLNFLCMQDYHIDMHIYGFLQAMVDELGVGPCMVVELSHTNASSDCNAVEAFRHFCGPADSVMILIYAEFSPKYVVITGTILRRTWQEK